MGLRKNLRNLRNRVNAKYIFSILPHGVSVMDDIALRCPGYDYKVIFDVGANVGRAASGYLASCPTAEIYCFEPIDEAYRQLELNMKHSCKVKCFNLAVGAEAGTGTMISEGVSKTNSLIANNVASETGGQRTEQVNITTLDIFCETNNIHHISYLKIDTEGADFDVLKGGNKLLTDKLVDFLEVEVGMNPGNGYHIPFETVKQFLERSGYFVFGIYEQINERPEKKPHLRRTNTVFISDAVIEKYSGRSPKHPKNVM